MAKNILRCIVFQLLTWWLVGIDLVVSVPDPVWMKQSGFKPWLGSPCKGMASYPRGSEDFPS